MQEKVQLTALEAKIFEGKAPPTSWFNENVVRFLQMQSEGVFLKDVLSFVKDIQSERLLKLVASPCASSPKLPAGASKEVVHDIYLYNGLMATLKKEITYLEKWIVAIQKANPELALELDASLTELKLIAKGLPAIQPAQLSFLNFVLQNLRSYTSKLPAGFQSQISEQELKMYLKMIQTIEEFLAGGLKDLKDLEETLGLIANLQNSTNGVANMLTKVRQTGQFSPEDFFQILAFLQFFIEEKSSPQVKKKLELLLKALAAIRASNGKNLPQQLSGSLWQTWIQAFLESNPQGSVEELKQYLVNLFEKSPLKQVSLPFFEELAGSLQTLLNKKEVPFVFEKNGKLTLDEGLLVQSFAVDGKSVIPALEAKKELSLALNEEEGELIARQEGISSALQSGNECRASFGRSAVSAVGDSDDDSVADDYKNAVLDHFIPYQEAYLMDLSFILYFDNYGAEMGNQLLNHVMDFQDAQTNYSFYDNLHSAGTSDPNEYIGTKDHLQAELDQEIAQDGRDLKKVESTLSYIDNKINAIKNDRTMSPHQKAILIHRLEKYRANLEAAKGQLTNLQVQLSHVRITDLGNGNCDVTMTSGSLSDVNYAEGNVINGYSTPPFGSAVGGLVNIQNMIQTDQEDSSDQGQNMQMRLQMHMTEFQQQMTIGSTGLQILNQAYMVLAQAIYK